MGEDSECEFETFAAAIWPRLVRSAHLLCGDRHLAEDLAQTALVKTYAAWPRVRRDDATAYTRRVLVNANIDRLRRRRFAEVGSDAGPPEPHEQTSVPSRIEDADLAVRLLAGLSARERRVLVLRHYFDLSEPVVARELGISVGTVKSTCSRALVKAREANPRLLAELELTTTPNGDPAP